jgi:ribonuclease BN (tRNA processing enzyme)
LAVLRVDNSPAARNSARVQAGQGVKLQVVGCGDAFGTGGRFNTCFRVEHGRGAFLIDCGASSLIAIRKLGLDPNAIGAIFVSHLHGDHFGGLPFFILDAQFYSRRRAPLQLVGPPGFRSRLEAAMEIFFPGSSGAARKFETIVHELHPGEPLEIDGVSVLGLEVRHACGAPALALRLSCENKVVAYSGDTEWTDALIEVGRDADLFIMEALTFEQKITQHLDYRSFLDNEARIGAKRILLTHFGPDMLARVGEARHLAASDGLDLEI